jgi:tetratricopeptide (TPR) repeat protein
MHLSSMRILRRCLILLLGTCVLAAPRMQNFSSAQAGAQRNSLPGGALGKESPADPARIFQQGQDALNQGRLTDAEKSFRRVLALDPQSAAAYASLGTVFMRRKQWNQALEMLSKAEKLAPAAAGIKLNIGLVYYRQNEFLRAIPPFEATVRDQPNSLQARYLLGLCYFFAERWGDAADTLDPLWAQESTQLNYLYVLSRAAQKAGRKDLDEKAAARMVEVGGDSAAFHLIIGKSHLNLDQYDMALTDLQAAAQADPKLPFVHFNLGLTYLKKQDYERARDEFLKDAAIEPDLAFNYDELGDVYALLQQDSDAEKNYREALRLDPRLINSCVGLAKIYQREEKYLQALAALDMAGKLDPGATNIHYLRGQVLLRMGRKQQGKKELETSVRIDNERRAAREKQAESGALPSPELLPEEQ